MEKQDYLGILKKIVKRKNGRILSKEYISAKTKLVIKCLDCAGTWRITPNNIKSGKWCPGCALKKSGNSRRSSIEGVRSFVLDKGGVCTSIVYRNTREKLDFICKEGHKFSASFGNIKSGKWCKACSRIKSTKWTIDKVREEALKYSTRLEFQKGSSSAYGSAKKNEILDEVCSHMIKRKRSVDSWTYKQVVEEASIYSKRKEFEKGSSGAYKRARSMGWMDKVCRHMDKGDWYNRGVYAFEFLDKSVYVGITSNYQRRYEEHLSKGKGEVFRKVKDFEFKFITFNKWYSRKEVKAAEQKKIDEYQRKGWRILNKACAGSLGGSELKWTKKLTASEAKKYKYRKDFSIKSPSAYKAAQEKGWLEQICTHMPKRKKVEIKLTKKHCSLIAKKYMNRTEFARSNDKSSYEKARGAGWLDAICRHMKHKHLPPNYWTIEKVLEEAKRFKTRYEFQKKSKSAYTKAHKSGWLEVVCSHMPQRKKTPKS